MAKNNNGLTKAAFTILAPNAKSVCVAGDFTGWDLSPKPLKKDKTGCWKVSVSLEPGRHEYRFIVDGKWIDDPQCVERVPNPFGELNCVRLVCPQAD
jgi:1,4-alpha-glucan branching enzyme